MRTSYLKELLAEQGMSFATRNGVEYGASVSTEQQEYGTVRNSVALTDFSLPNFFPFPKRRALTFSMISFPVLWDNFVLVVYCTPFSPTKRVM